jgi:hypothetical protein
MWMCKAANRKLLPDVVGHDLDLLTLRSPIVATPGFILRSAATPGELRGRILGEANGHANEISITDRLSCSRSSTAP